jgi:hypothetical protein
MSTSSISFNCINKHWHCYVNTASNCLLYIWSKTNKVLYYISSHNRNLFECMLLFLDLIVGLDFSYYQHLLQLINLHWFLHFWNFDFFNVLYLPVLKIITCCQTKIVYMLTSMVKGFVTFLSVRNNGGSFCKSPESGSIEVKWPSKFLVYALLKSTQCSCACLFSGAPS